MSSGPIVHYLWIVGGALFSVLCLWGSMHAGRRKRLLQDLPTSKVRGVFIGFVELKGTAEVEAPLTSFLAEAHCVHHSWNISEHWSRTVIETYTDEKGNTQTRTRHESGWTTVDSGGASTPFYLMDDTGIVRIIPDGATIEAATVFNHHCGRDDPLYYGKGPDGAIADSDHRRAFTECAIPLHAEIYVVGQARERDDVVAPQIAADPEAHLFLISTRAEDAVTRGMHWTSLAWAIFGMALFVGGFIGLAGARSLGPREVWPLYLAAAAAYLPLWFIAWLWMAFNSLIGLRKRVQHAWSLIDIQLKRRHDLIPNLVQIVQTMRDYESNVQEELARLRTQAGATAPGAPGPDPAAVANASRIVLEKYPELKANESFMGLHQALVDTEHRIALARTYFNDIASFYNTRLDIIPDKFVAWLIGAKPRELLAAADFERAPVKVSLAA